MVFLRKLLSSGNKLHQQFAIDMWCTWLDHRISFSEQQEEEIVSALKNSVAACHDIQAWSFGRLEQAFQRNGPQTISPGISLRKSSWEELYRFLSQEAGKFVQPTPSSITGYQNGDGDDSGDEYDEEDSSLPQFRFSSLDAFYQQNASLDGAASTGLIFQKLLSCMIAFEEAASRLKVSSDGLAVESLNENNRDIKQWLVDMASNWKYFFHWVCQDADDLLSPSVQSKICEKSAWWKLVARVYIGCAICNVVIEILMRRRVVDSTEDTEQALMAFHADDSGLSVWSLMEVEFSLHRMIQKLAIHYSNEMEASISKEYVRAASYGLRRVLQPGKLQILTAIKAAPQDTAATRVSQSDRPIGMSFDGVIFSLDSCCSPLQEDDMYGSFPYWDNEDSGALTILETMFSIYLTIRERILTLSGHSSNDDSRNINSFASNGSETDYRLQFSVYADSISAKFPALARHLVTPGRGTKSMVLLDAKSGEELLEHICSAIGRTLEMMIKATDLQSVDTQLGNALRNISWPNDSQQSNSGRGETCSNFVHLSRYFLSDVKKCVQLDRFTRLSVSCASLSKRLRDVGAELVDWSTNSSDGHTLSSLAYDVLCDNVVYNPRLLRLLSSICLPTYFSSRLDTFVAMESKIEGIIQACGLDSSVYTSSPKVLTRERPSHVLTIKKKKHKDKTPAHRKRLRHGFDARSSYGLRVDSDSDSDASYSSDSSISDSDDSRANVESNTNGGKLIQYVSPSRDRIPHLQSHATQSIAILAVLAVLEQSQSTLLKTIAGKNSNNEPHMFPHHQEIMGYIRIHELVIKAICNNRDFSWGTRKVLVKILHIIELGLRIGKASGAVQKGDDLDTSLRNETTFCILESSVLCAVRSRTWVDSLKDASHDSGTKSKVRFSRSLFVATRTLNIFDFATKVSATLLKMDVFFLQVPGTVQAWLKETMLSDALKDRLKALVTVVKEKMAPTDDKSARRGKAKPRQRLLGVVPIVRKRRKRLRSRHPIIDAFLNEEDGADAFADLEDFIE
ncbi:unnamed protein product [Phytophthora lilii]|uniref:Unnamed protein product n=1 Tax=Phytophthora lilii TaxID=2077276 RepID=A0A9W6TEG5_9STRA|nr:unnamed protein product [Phytophthora lilii]